MMKQMLQGSCASVTAQSIVCIFLAILFITITPFCQTLHIQDKRQADFIRSLHSYHVTHPSIVSNNGNFLSHDLHPAAIRRQRRSTNTRREPVVHYKLPLPSNDEYVVLRVVQNHRLLSPGISVERWRNVYGNLSDVRLHAVRAENEGCFYRGTLKDDARSQVAVSACNGLRGFFHYNGEDYFIEPIKGHNSSHDPRHPHIVYKGSALPERRGRVREDSAKHTCGVSDRQNHDESKRSVGKGEHHSSASRRRKRSVSAEKYVETLVVVDPSMMKYYEHEDIENYVLTIMNMVSTVFHDASIGNAMNIVIVRLLLLEDDQDQLKISHHADNTLASFCRWQKIVNPKGDDHPNHHDTAILLTRHNICSRMNQPCSTLGLAQVSGMCQKHRSCSINEDTGLALAYTITHELGHNFGMKHDGVNNFCKTTDHTQYVMSPHLIADSSPLVWSNCSRAALTRFLDREWGYCLDDEPTAKPFQYPVLPPGTMYDANHQCRLIYGPDAELCDGIENICSTLWCRINNKCLTKLEAAAEGTLCASQKWCFAGNCTMIGDRPDAVDGQWGEWGEWLPCTRTCGSGVSLQERHCNNPSPAHGGRYCLGERKRYRICNTMECDENEPNFRQVQCSAFNNKFFKKKLYKWEPVQSAVNPCQLHCKPVDKYFSVLARDIVIDGTPCRHGSKDMCIGGRCRHIGCDWQIDSNAKEDRCGVCHGDSTACKVVKEKFSRKNGHGYVEATVIPVGARNIRVEEVAAANNYLALRNDQGDYYLNGNWFIQWSGDYELAGTTIRYVRSGNKESFVAAGPLKEQLHLMLLFQADNPGVSFEYTVPTDNSTTKRTPYFRWVYTDWSPCTALCGAGTQRSKVGCMETEMGMVDDRYCDRSTKLDDRQRVCNTNQCPARWWVGPWQHCSVSCGDDGYHHRTVICVRGLGIGEQIALDDSECGHLPAQSRVKPCRSKTPCPRKGTWVTGQWDRECNNNPCRVQWRSVTCSDAIVGCDLDAKPPLLRRCTVVKCGQWKVSIWSLCSVSCGNGLQYRNVFCDNRPCDMDKEPVTKQSCHMHACPTTTTKPTTTQTTATPTTTSTSIASTTLAPITTKSTRMSPTASRTTEKSAAPISYTQRPTSTKATTTVTELLPFNHYFLLKPTSASTPLHVKIRRKSTPPTASHSHTSVHNVTADILDDNNVSASSRNMTYVSEPSAGLSGRKVEKSVDFLGQRNTSDVVLDDNNSKTEETDVMSGRNETVTQGLARMLNRSNKSTNTTESSSQGNLENIRNVTATSNVDQKDFHKYKNIAKVSSSHVASTVSHVASTVNHVASTVNHVASTVNLIQEKSISHNLVHLEENKLKSTVVLSGDKENEKFKHSSRVDKTPDTQENFKIIYNIVSKMSTVKPKSETETIVLSSDRRLKNIPAPYATEKIMVKPNGARIDIHNDLLNVNEQTSNTDVYIPKVENLDSHKHESLVISSKGSDSHHIKYLLSNDNVKRKGKVESTPKKEIQNEELLPYLSEGGSEFNGKISNSKNKILNKDKGYELKGKSASNSHMKMVKLSDEENIRKKNHVDKTGSSESGSVNSGINISVNRNHGNTTEYVDYQAKDSSSGNEIDKPDSGYAWAPLSWEKCSSPCGNGTRSRSIVCVIAASQTLADDENCALIPQPPTEERCFSPPCLDWVTTEWEACTPRCSPSSRRRHIYCPVPLMCDDMKKPVLVEPCDITQPCVTWIAGEWSMCSKSCGGGIQKRMVQCVNLVSQQTTTNCDPTTKPDTKQWCNKDKCQSQNAALSQKCKHNKMGYKICQVLKTMKQCKKSFVRRNCCKSCGIEYFNLYRQIHHGRRPKHKSRGHKVEQ